MGKKKNKREAAESGVSKRGAAAEQKEEAEEEDSDSEADAPMVDEEDEEDNRPAQVFRPGVDQLEEGQELDYDSRAYTTYHKMSVEWPCLSFDIIRDGLGLFRTKFPMTFYMIAGTQAGSAEENKVMLLKVSEVHKTKNDEDSDADSESDEDDLDDDPVVEEKFFLHPGGTNRIRSMPQNPSIVATLADTGKVHVWDTQHHLNALNKPNKLPPLNPVFTFNGHTEEGYALDWSGVVAGNMITGDCTHNIYLWSQREASFVVDQVPFAAHTESVEDLQWSPNEATVFASCSMDKTIRIWDTRVRRHMAFITAHDADVNVISWNRRVSHLLASGADDGIVKVWDLRQFKADSPAANFKWHQGPISSVEWHPVEDSIMAVASADNSISCWDLALENDPEAKAEGASLGDVEIPPQLLFVHHGQTDIKELHFHPQCPGLVVSTALDGFNIFKPANM